MNKSVPLCKDCVSGQTQVHEERNTYRFCQRYNEKAINVRPEICKGEYFQQATPKTATESR